MFGQEQWYLFADPVFYEDVSRWDEERTRFGATQRQVPAGWQRLERGPWVVLRPTDHVLPDQGWKIHIAARPGNADRICDVAWDYCVAEGVPFKFLRGGNVMFAHSTKYAPRSASGKLVTIYPSDEQQLHHVLTELGQRLAGEDGPYILSDLRWGDGPLYVRYGGFVERRCPDGRGNLVHAIARPDGVLVPDQRRPVFHTPPWVQLPDFLAPHLAARRAASGGTMPYRVEKALHFSNGGGVYLARRIADGTPVVLKEARPLAGLDENRDDAITRLRRERWALATLAGVDGVPAMHDYLTVGGHEFLVEEFIDGQTLQVWQGCEHPMVVNDHPTPEQFDAYTSEALDLHEKITDLIGRLHERGIAFADLHPANVIVRPDGSVALVDFELAHPVEAARAPGLGAAGFVGAGLAGRARDDHALAALALWLFMPLNRVLVLDPTRADDYFEVAAERFRPPREFLDAARTRLRAAATPAPAARGVALEVRLDADVVNWPAVCRSMADAILASATPERTDRLFPGDIRQFTHDALDIANGAAGVLWALDATGCGRYPQHEQWLVRATLGGRRRGQGFYDGIHGVAYVLDRLGHPDTAAQVLAEAVPAAAEIRAVDLYGGLAGIGLNLLHFAQVSGDGRYRDEALAAGKRLGEALDLATGGGTPAGGATPVARGSAGLMRGWSGVALCFVRLYEATGDSQWLTLAVRALHRDLDGCVISRGGSLQVEEPGVRTLSYLDIGSAGIALVADEVLTHRADARLVEALPSLVRACSAEFVLQANLFKGRSGLLAATARAGDRIGAGPRETVARHLRRLAWHAVSYRGHLAFPGDQSLRLSMDLASGTSGVLLAVHAATSPSHSFLPFFSPRARAGAL